MFDGIKLSVQQAGSVFGEALGYEDEDGKLTLADLPKIFAKIKEKIGSLQKLLSKIRKPKRGIGGVDDAVTVQIQAHILEVGKGLTQLANVLGVSEEEIRTIYKNMNIEQVSAFIANGTQENEDLALAQQVAAYAKMIKDNKGKRVVIDPQMLGNSLKLTLDFVTQLQAMIPVADALSQQDQAFVGRFAGKVNWKKCGSYVGVAVTILGSVLALGEQQGWWDIYPN